MAAPLVGLAARLAAKKAAKKWFVRAGQVGEIVKAKTRSEAKKKALNLKGSSGHYFRLADKAKNMTLHISSKNFK